MRRAGRRALLVEAPDAATAEALHAELLRRRAAGTLPPVRELVPGARTVLLDGLDEPGRLAAELPHWHLPPASRQAAATVGIPVRYDGPDLPEVAALWGVSTEEVVRVHTGTAFRVAFCGFAPGFGYLTGLDERYRVPRRESPRTRVPAGAVALAGTYAGVYPRPSPGGWQLIGTAVGTVLWDPGREPAALLTPGTRVRFTEAGSAAGSADGSAAGPTGEGAR
ncbi:allophanate hydrolase subunit 1 [Streptomyces sp. JJ36]|uniref:5-oxoprolinase subunit B family protein n=1 Tax=Streptomyces sp. JJ36 TaxID=2736645 RepID=UPI001F2E9C26|nr:allophanate hydrolase subunit 1 [Streptomyces sp. JJ36]MCF6524104.1 allophanate hydrolase subunit 1 [Streptomyces sp. JJ36]